MKKSYQNAVSKIEALGFTEPAAPEVRRNKYTDKQHTLVPLAVMFDFITALQDRDLKGFELINGQPVTRQTWDNARYLFQTTWSDEYYDLLD